MRGVLDGVRVLDFGRYVAAPYCATLLGYLGADVIRIERPGGGDDRWIAPLADDGSGAVFLQTGCNKRSVCLKLGSSAGDEVRSRLLRSADVVVSNFPPAIQRRLGFDYATLCETKPDIILANVSAFGTEGPLAAQGGFDGVGQAMSGAMFMTGDPGKPAKAAAPYVDYTTAVLTAFAVMAALRERDRSGQGQEVSAALLASALAVFNSHLIEQSVAKVDRQPTGNRVQTSAPSDVFATEDGHVLVHCPGDAIFKRWCALVEKPEFETDPRFANDQLRGDHRDALCEPMAKWCAARTSAAALEQLAAAGVPSGPVLSIQQALDHAQTQALGVLGKVEYPGLSSPAPVADMPVRLSVSDTGIRGRPPTAGEHTDQVLAELGFSSAEIIDMRADGTVA
ncbi:MAG: CoA transferase [Pseudomonadota bacterium]